MNTILNKSKDLRKIPSKVLSVAQKAIDAMNKGDMSAVQVRFLKHVGVYCVELPTYYRMVANKGSNAWLIVSHEEYSKRFSMHTAHRGTKGKK